MVKSEAEFTFLYSLLYVRWVLGWLCLPVIVKYTDKFSLTRSFDLRGFPFLLFTLVDCKTSLNKLGKCLGEIN